MGRKRKGNPVNGWMNFYKPRDLTSTQAVSIIRKKLNAQKAGHAGTLDPLAEGILPIALGEATKTISFMQDRPKIYYFSILWGQETTTDDAEGDVTHISEKRPGQEDIKAILSQFTGKIQQRPPAFSAIKIDGERAYDRARAGEDVKIQERTVYIHDLKLRNTTDTHARFVVQCSKGTYVRALARDMARKLGTYGYMNDLVRWSVGSFTADDSITLDNLENLGHSAPLSDVVLPVEAVLDDIPALDLSKEEADRLKTGQKLSFIARPDFERLENLSLAGADGTKALARYKGQAIALVHVDGPDIKPDRVFNLNETA